jgi:hypothetical protein
VVDDVLVVCFVDVEVGVGVDSGVHTELEVVVGWSEPSLNHHDP